MARRYEIPTFLGETLPVEFVARLERWEANGRSLTLHCAANRYRPELHDYYGTVCETVWDPPTPGVPVTVQIDFCTAEILRLRFFVGPAHAPGDSVPENETPMVVGQFNEPVNLAVTENEAAVAAETAVLRLTVTRDPFQLQLTDLAGNSIWRTLPVDVEALMRPPLEEQWNPSQQRWIFLHRYAYPLGHAAHGDKKVVFASFGLGYDEHIYGFGESYGRLDKRETQQTLWIQESFSNASPAAYKRAPFYMSTRGYGLFVNTSNAIRFRVGDLEHTALSAIVDDTDLFDAYLIYGPTLREILPRYTAVTGQPAVPPKWSFGLWMGRISYSRQDQVAQVAADLRAHQIPCDVIHIDTDWYENDWECDLKFGQAKFPNPSELTRSLREKGFRISLWQWPNMVITSSMYKEGYDGGYLVKQKNGTPYHFTGFGPDAGLIDYSNPAAAAWVKEKFRALFRLGIAAIKTDFGEGSPPDGVYHGVPGESMRNRYPLLYNEAVFGVTEEMAGQGKGIVWSRSAWAGSQRYPVHWSGDGVARFEDLACVLRAALSFGLSGFPFYSHDVGGFSGLPSPELYVRWAQLGMFGSHVRCHGAPPREPWAYGPEAERIFRQYDELRYRLLPYIYSEAVKCGRSSLPMMRPLALIYQDDPNTYTIDDQYLFGDSLLVAPILDETNRRRLYLPAGEWVDYWSGARLHGGRWLAVEAALDVLPLYVKAGAILPYGPVLQYVDERPLDPLTLEIYAPADAGSYTIHDEDRPDIQVAYRRSDGKLWVEVRETPGAVEVVVIGDDAPAVVTR
jgi:alpha-D-xyloside xylohydrolase